MLIYPLSPCFSCPYRLTPFSSICIALLPCPRLLTTAYMISGRPLTRQCSSSTYSSLSIRESLICVMMTWYERQRLEWVRRAEEHGKCRTRVPSACGALRSCFTPRASLNTTSPSPSPAACSERLSTLSPHSFDYRRQCLRPASASRVSLPLFKSYRYSGCAFDAWLRSMGVYEWNAWGQGSGQDGQGLWMLDDYRC